MSELKTITEALNYEPTGELIKMILTEVQSTGKSIAECAGKYSLPRMFTGADAATEAKIWHQKYPHSKIAIIA